MENTAVAGTFLTAGASPTGQWFTPAAVEAAVTELRERLHAGAPCPVLNGWEKREPVAVVEDVTYDPATETAHWVGRTPFAARLGITDRDDQGRLILDASLYGQWVGEPRREVIDGITYEAGTLLRIHGLVAKAPAPVTLTERRIL